MTLMSPDHLSRRAIRLAAMLESRAAVAETASESELLIDRADRMYRIAEQAHTRAVLEWAAHPKNMSAPGLAEPSGASNGRSMP